MPPDESLLKKSGTVRVVDIKDHDDSKTAVILLLRLPDTTEVEFFFDLISDDPKLIVEEMKADSNLPLTGVSDDILLESISPVVQLAKIVAMRIEEVRKVSSDDKSKIVGSGGDADGRDERVDKEEINPQNTSSSTSSNNTTILPGISALSPSSSSQPSSFHDALSAASLSERILYEVLFMDIYLKEDIEVNRERGSRFERYRSRAEYFEPLVNIARTINHIDRGNFTDLLNHFVSSLFVLLYSKF